MLPVDRNTEQTHQSRRKKNIVRVWDCGCAFVRVTCGQMHEGDTSVSPGKRQSGGNEEPVCMCDEERGRGALSVLVLPADTRSQVL
jgi:hypothetical protein